LIDRFGVTVDWRGATVGAVTTIALQADYSGCGHFWMPEAWGLEAFSSAGRLLSVTKRIKVGTGIVNIFSRSAATIAMGCATLSQVAPNRFLLGLGVSGKGLVESFHGIRFEKTLKRTEEYVETIKKIQTGEPVDYNGEILKLARFRLYTLPVSPPVPIYLGAIGEKNLTLAGKICDGAIVTLYPISKLRKCVEFLDHGSQGKKRKLFAYIPLRVTSNEREEAEAKLEVSKFIAFYIASMGKYYAENLTKLGFGKEVEEIKNANSSGGLARAVSAVSEEMLRELSLIGSSLKIFDRLAKIPDGIYPVFALAASSPKEGDISARALREISVTLASHKPREI
jgi:alkanesulfonate monooxygenase SsuD/methylene tetrahydromethanopterin reductase-like flavin-dependent oxidoreductase (luciferase family)